MIRAADSLLPRAGTLEGVPAHRLCVAPMMERTDRHCRYLLRLVAPRAWLYTEMITARALINGDRARLLRFDAREHPVALQIGGSEAGELAAAARFGADMGYDEINLNVGCPSGRVQAGCFGAALMLDAARVAECVAAMREAVPARVPVTVKTRLGVDDHDSYDFLHGFAAAIVAAGCRTLIVHARKAWLSGLSPKENREIPPLDYARVHRLKRDFPGVEIVVNGGLTSAAAVRAQLAHVDGIMLGRSAYADPMLLADLETVALGGRSDRRSDFSRDSSDSSASSGSRLKPLLHDYCAYIEAELRRGTPLKAMTRHLTGLYARTPGARRWRRGLTELADGAAGFRQLRSLIAAHEDRGCAARARAATIAHPAF